MTTIITAPPGGTAYVYGVAAELMNASWTEGLSLQGTYSTKVGNIIAGLPDTSTAGHITVTNVTPATVSAPAATASVGDALTLYDGKYASILAMLDTKLASFRSSYYPDETANYHAASAWLAAELANPDRVLPAALAAIIWEEDRSRIIADSLRGQDEVVALWAAKRYPMPPGAAISAVIAIQQKEQDQLAASSRNVAIKTFEMAYDKVKFVVERCLSARQEAMSATLEFLKEVASTPASASQTVGMGYDSEGKLRSAAATYYQADTEAKKLSYAGAEYNARAAATVAEKNQAFDLAIIGDKVQALVSEAHSIATMCASLLNNLHVSSNLSGSDSVQTSY